METSKNRLENGIERHDNKSQIGLCQGFIWSSPL
jgi:hypothetical protein